MLLRMASPSSFEKRRPPCRIWLISRLRQSAFINPSFACAFFRQEKMTDFVGDHVAEHSGYRAFVVLRQLHHTIQKDERVDAELGGFRPQREAEGPRSDIPLAIAIRKNADPEHVGVGGGAVSGTAEARAVRPCVGIPASRSTRDASAFAKRRRRSSNPGS